MAQRRMFSINIISSAKFLKMPSSTRLLYYDLGMRADDDGVVEAFNVLRMTGSTEDDLRVLVSKGYIKVLNEDLVTFITDWNEHNRIRADRKVNSMYKDLLLQVIPEAKLIEPRQRADLKKKTGRPLDEQRTNMDSIGKVSIGKDSLGQFSTGECRLDKNSIESDADNVTVDNYIDFFNNNFHLITRYEFETLNSYLEDGITEEAILLALKKALDNGARNIKYVKKILDTWLTNNIKTVEDVNAADAEFKRNKTTKEKTIVIKKESTFNNCSQRDYSSDQINSLERKLLGWEEYTDER